MTDNKNRLFSTLEAILSVVMDINTITQNQETILLHGSADEMLAELASNKQALILKLDELEVQFQSIYEENKEVITSKQDVERLQSLVGQVVAIKTTIAQGEDKNKRLWDSKVVAKVHIEPVQQPKSYVVDQYKKHSKI